MVNRSLATKTTWLCLLFLTLTGCHGDGRSPTGSVEGTVTVDGQPLDEGTIIFESPGKRPASGEIRAGKIVNVMTYVAGDGVPTGSQKVAINATVATSSISVPDNPGQVMPVDANYMGVGESLIPAKYNNPETSGLTAEIKPGKNSLQFDVKTK